MRRPRNQPVLRFFLSRRNDTYLLPITTTVHLAPRLEPACLPFLNPGLQGTYGLFTGEYATASVFEPPPCTDEPARLFPPSHVDGDQHYIHRQHRHTFLVFAAGVCVVDGHGTLRAAWSFIYSADLFNRDTMSALEPVRPLESQHPPRRRRLLRQTGHKTAAQAVGRRRGRNAGLAGQQHARGRRPREGAPGSR
ncbi:hypothetical protein CDD83_10314 [Cordyceps sp. RAO-2017]|nr:hypothetical protein CDD83_10314 [Cordyceps sp. RAO-2017]